ncbi:MAG: Asparagine synthetase [glutamine-hydrolyzing] 1 [Candidatus Methanoperedenaceae archaeon GB50]|nr:MAG: Asparagine synthetase [glutamine-hydrolyzing] 1 [Candidatus Methanoperedenaceae archaeon GB50]
MGKETFFRNIFEVPAAHLVLISKDLSIKEIPYWDIDFNSPLKLDTQKAIEQLIFLLKKSLIKIKNFNCKSVIFQSRGIDSVLLSIFLKFINLNSSALTIAFDIKKYDESSEAKKICEIFGIQNDIFQINGKIYSQNLPKAIWFNDEPLRYPGAVSFYIACEKLSKELSHVIFGEGADVLFAGYPMYYLIYLTKLPCWIKILLQHFIFKMPFTLFSSLNKKKKILQVLKCTVQEYLVYSTLYSSPEEVNILLKKQNKSYFLKRLKIAKSLKNNGDFRKYLLYLDLKSLSIPEKMVVNSGKIPFYPFLDYNLVEFVNALPMALKVRSFKPKYLLKKMAEKFLPKSIIYQKKSGFGTPLEYWFRDKNSLGKYLQMLEEDRTLDRGIFNPDELIKIAHQFKHGKRPPEDYDGLLWTIVNLELWHRIFIDQDYESEYC